MVILKADELPASLNEWKVRLSMTKSEMFEPIIINESKPDSRSLIMPHQQEAVDAMTSYYSLEQELPGRSGMVVMPTAAERHIPPFHGYW